MPRALCILSGPVTNLKVQHWLVKGSYANSVLFPPPIFLIVDGDNNKPTGALLYRFDADGGCLNDTWHQSLDDAKRDAADEYEGLVQAWEEIPENLSDEGMVAFALTRIKKS